MKEADKIELRSDEIQDILTRPPHILIRSGISVICGVVALLFIGSFFFKYPDLVQGEIVITTENPPVWIIAKSTGKIKELNCEDKSLIQAGQTLAVIENPALTEDVMQLKELLPQCRVTDSVFFVPSELTLRNYELGTIQNAYSAFIRMATNCKNFLSLNAIGKEKEALLLQISNHRKYSENLRKQLELKQEELKLAQSEYEREKQLYQKKIISSSEMEAAENIWLTVRQSTQQLQTSLASDRIESGQLTESLSKLDMQYEREKNNALSDWKTAYSELLSTIENWEQAYLLVSPVDGIVTFHSFWKNNQYLTAGNKVLAVVPQQPGELFGRIRCPSSMSGKIKPGQRINIKLAGYPYMEYGALRGNVRNISLIPDENSYTIDVVLPQGLMTGTGRQLHFTGELNGQAEIVTDDRSLFSRILSPLKYLWENHTQ